MNDVTDTVVGHLSREQRRQRTEAAILHAAQQQFAEDGYERTTIRSVAAAASVDPALVMQHFGSKERLFAVAAKWSSAHETVLDAPREQVAAAALTDVMGRFEDEDTREAAAALMRNCLTHPEASRIIRDEVMCERMDLIARRIGGDDGSLRAALLGAIMMGFGLSRYVLEIPEVAAASQEDIRRVLEPALQALVGSAGDDGPADDAGPTGEGRTDAAG